MIATTSIANLDIHSLLVKLEAVDSGTFEFYTMVVLEIRIF